MQTTNDTRSTSSAAWINSQLTVLLSSRKGYSRTNLQVLVEASAFCKQSVMYDHFSRDVHKFSYRHCARLRLRDILVKNGLLSYWIGYRIRCHLQSACNCQLLFIYNDIVHKVHKKKKKMHGIRSFTNTGWRRKNGATISLQIFWNSMTELRGNWWTSAILYSH